jgi:shikimate dehydrogenase
MDQYAVVGNPIQHSLSPFIHSLFAAQTKQHLTYKAILVPMDGFAKTLAHFQVEGGKGLNITLPFKQEAFNLMDTFSKRALTAKAVNTVSINADGSRHGDNTDGIGLIRDLTKNLQLNLHNKRILILGAGGAIQGILAPLLTEKPSQIIIANRTVNKAEELIKSFGNGNVLDVCSLSDLNHASFDIVINGISAGLHGEMPSLNTNVIHENTFCYDLVYGKKVTPFLQWAKEQGATHITDGLGMLIEQAAEAFYMWRGVMPDTQSVITQLRLVPHPTLNLRVGAQIARD